MESGRQGDLFAGEQGKREGLDRVSRNASEWLTHVRGWAKAVARRKGEVSSDDLRLLADTYGVHPHHQNAWGAVFRGDEWEPAGFKKSTYKTNHARRITVWRLAL